MLGRSACAVALLSMSCTFPDIAIVSGSGGASSVAASSTSAGGSGGDPCANPDEDGDTQDSAACGGPDCNDNDDRVKLGQTEYFAEPMNPPIAPGGAFDFDCSDAEEPEPTKLFSGCNPVGCVGEGWDPQALACGTSNGWVVCSLLTGMLCEPQPTTTSELLKCH